MTYNASSRKDIRAAEKLEAEARRAHLEFLAAAMSTAQGRAWFHAHLASCQCFVVVPTFEPNRDYFDIGRKSVGLPLMADLQTHCPNEYLQMMREEDARINTAAERSRVANPGWDAEGRDALDDNTPDLFDNPGAFDP